jgi:hypothetical protein
MATALYNRIKDRACHSEARHFKGLSYKQAYRKALRRPYYLGWFLRRIVAQDYTFYPEAYNVGLDLMYVLRPTKTKRARAIVRQWAKARNIKLS